MPTRISAGDGQLPLFLHLMTILYCCAELKERGKEPPKQQPGIQLLIDISITWTALEDFNILASDLTMCTWINW